jgi:outer membrane protein TolC
VKTRPSGDVRERLTPGAGVEAAHELEVEIEQIRARLAANEAERKELEATLRDLVSRRSTTVANYSSPATAHAPRVTAASPGTEKVALFRRLFAGRADVFPQENRVLRCFGTLATEHGFCLRGSEDDQDPVET